MHIHIGIIPVVCVYIYSRYVGGSYPEGMTGRFYSANQDIGRFSPSRYIYLCEQYRYPVSSLRAAPTMNDSALCWVVTLLTICDVACSDRLKYKLCLHYTSLNRIFFVISQSIQLKSLVCCAPEFSV